MKKEGNFPDVKLNPDLDDVVTKFKLLEFQKLLS